MFEKIQALICKHSGKEPEEITPDTNLLTDLGMQSIDFVDLICDFEEEFDHEVPERDFKRLTTVQNIMEYIEEKKV